MTEKKIRGIVPSNWNNSSFGGFGSPLIVHLLVRPSLCKIRTFFFFGGDSYKLVAF